MAFPKGRGEDNVYKSGDTMKRTKSVKYAIVAILTVLFVVACKPTPRAPAKEAALRAVAQYLSERTANTDGRPLKSEQWCPGWKYNVGVSQVAIGQFNAASNAWPARVTVIVTCPHGTPTQATEDYMLVEDGFGGWKVSG
jgi:hypothetical protein